jgi:hypothetical protein
MTPKADKSAGLDSLIQRKGAAQRPGETQQRGHIHPPDASEPRTKAMTLKLTERDYTRLIRAGISPRRTNQDMMEEAVLAWLDANGY